LLYDHPFVWNAATTYVGLTRHREHVQLYVPRDLAADEATLVRQMSRVTEQVLASDLLPAESTQARNDLIRALYPAQEPIMLTFGRREDRLGGDLNLEQTRLALIRHLKSAPIAQFVADYKDLARLSSTDEKDTVPNQAELLRRQAAEIARRRGFRPSTGEPDRSCLHNQLLPQEMADHYIDGRFAGDENEIDVQPLAFQPGLVNYGPFMKMAWRLRQLDAIVLDAILERVQSLRELLIRDEAISGVLGLASYVVKVSRAIAYGLPAEAADDWRELRRAEPAPRLVWKPLRFHRPKDRDWPPHLVRMSSRSLERLDSSVGLASTTASAPIRPSPAEPPSSADGMQRWPNRPEETTNSAPQAAKPAPPPPSRRH
jgi:hypothetical protein